MYREDLAEKAKKESDNYKKIEDEVGMERNRNGVDDQVAAESGDASGECDAAAEIVWVFSVCWSPFILRGSEGRPVFHVNDRKWGRFCVFHLLFHFEAFSPPHARTERNIQCYDSRAAEDVGRNGSLGSDWFSLAFLRDA